MVNLIHVKRNNDLALLAGLWPGVEQADVVRSWYVVAELHYMRREHARAQYPHTRLMHTWTPTLNRAEPASANNTDTPTTYRLIG